MIKVRVRLKRGLRVGMRERFIPEGSEGFLVLDAHDLSKSIDDQPEYEVIFDSIDFNGSSWYVLPEDLEILWANMVFGNVDVRVTPKEDEYVVRVASGKTLFSSILPKESK